MRKALFLSVFALAGLVSFNASAADELGEPGQLALSGERIFGLNFWSGTASPEGSDDVTISGTSVGLLVNGSPTAAPGDASFPLPYTVPRLGLDYMVADGVSIGGNVGYVHGTSSVDNGSQETDLPTASGFIIAPRVGYVIPVSDGADFWVRGGITYYSMSSEADNEGTTVTESLNGLALTAEGAFVLSPIAGFGFFVGPTIDLGLSGTYTLEASGQSQDTDVTTRNFGANAGLVGWF